MSDVREAYIRHISTDLVMMQISRHYAASPSRLVSSLFVERRGYTENSWCTRTVVVVSNDGGCYQKDKGGDGGRKMCIL